MVSSRGTVSQLALPALAGIVKKFDAPSDASADASQLGQELSHRWREPLGHAASLALRGRQILIGDE